MLTQFPQAVPEIPVSNIDKAAEYYVKAFGFSFDWMGRNRSQLVALAPKGVPASDIFGPKTCRHR